MVSFPPGKHTHTSRGKKIKRRGRHPPSFSRAPSAAAESIPAQPQSLSPRRGRPRAEHLLNVINDVAIFERIKPAMSLLVIYMRKDTNHLHADFCVSTRSVLGLVGHHRIGARPDFDPGQDRVVPAFTLKSGLPQRNKTRIQKLDRKENRAQTGT